MKLSQEELNDFTVEELEDILSLKNATLYELNSIWKTLNRQETSSNSEQSKIKEVKEEIALIKDMITSKKENSDAKA